MKGKAIQSFSILVCLLCGILAGCGGTEQVRLPKPVPITSVSVQPGALSMIAGDSRNFSALDNHGRPASVRWAVDEGAAGGSVAGVTDFSAAYTAPVAAGTYHVTATSTVNPALSAKATIVVEPVSVVVQPATDTLGPSTQRAFRATTQSGDPNPLVTWLVVESPAGGTITSNGLYAAPATEGTYHVVATSSVDPSKSSMATVTVVPAGFRPAANLLEGRAAHTATLLPDGRVLFIGGACLYCEYTNFMAEEFYYSAPIASAEIFDPEAGFSLVTGQLNVARYGHTATLLPDGRVLVAGGFIVDSPSTGNVPTGSAEIHDPATGQFTVTGALRIPRGNHTATLLANGAVLISGGATFDSLVEAETYDPVSGTFSLTGDMQFPRQGHTATALQDGRVLIVGGFGAYGPDTVAQAELYDPQSRTFAGTGSLASPREYHSATLMPSGKVLIAGGDSRNGLDATAEFYDPPSGTFVPAGSMSATRTGHTATLLQDGRVLLAGGVTDLRPDLGLRVTTTRAELYDPSTGVFTPTGGLFVARFAHTATLLGNGSVLIAGGVNGDSQAPIVTCEVYP